LIGTLDFILRLLIGALAISCPTFVLKAKAQEPPSGCYERADENEADQIQGEWNQAKRQNTKAKSYTDDANGDRIVAR
jgi:hypothetical protein